MSKLEQAQFEDDEVTDEDYGFIIGPDGELKSMFLPAKISAVPQSVTDLLDMFGVEMNSEHQPVPSSAGQTLH